MSEGFWLRLLVAIARLVLWVSAAHAIATANYGLAQALFLALVADSVSERSKT